MCSRVINLGQIMFRRVLKDIYLTQFKMRTVKSNLNAKIQCGKYRFREYIGEGPERNFSEIAEKISEIIGNISKNKIRLEEF